VTYAINTDYSPKIMSKLKSSYEESLQKGEEYREIFDWPSALKVLDKVIEEANELKEAIKSQNKTETFAEASDLVFTVVQTLRHLKIDLGDSLEFSNKKFQIRFNGMEEIASQRGLNLKNLSNDELELIWAESKALTKNKVQKLLSQ